MGSYTIAVLPGDGIGPEVIHEAVRVLRAVTAPSGHTLTLREALAGEAAIAAEGAPISDATVALCAQSDAVLFGAVGGAQSERRAISQQAGRAITRLRKDLGLFANVRPVRPVAALASASPLRRERLQGVDLVVVRELTGGLYYGKPSEIRESAQGASAVDTMAYTEAGDRACHALCLRSGAHPSSPRHLRGQSQCAAYLAALAARRRARRR